MKISEKMNGIGDFVTTAVKLILTMSLFSCAALAQEKASSAKMDGRYFAIQSGYGNLSSKLSGEGFNSELKGASGLLYGVKASYQEPESDVHYTLSYDKISADQSAPSGVTPNMVAVSREELKYVVSLAPWNEGFRRNFRVGFGYSILETGAKDTLPNNVLTKMSSQGFVATFSHTTEAMSAWPVLSEILVYLPHQVKESSQVTGYNPKYLGGEFNVSFEHAMDSNIIGFFGARYRMDQVSFEGSVNRGVTDGIETRVLTAIFFGIKAGY